MKIKCSIATIISASAAMLGYHCQIIDAFQIHGVSYKAKQWGNRSIRFPSPLSTACTKPSISLTRVGTTRPSNTKLFVGIGSGGDNKRESTLMNSPSSINIPLITQTLANQFLIGFGNQIWTVGNGFFVLAEKTQFGAGPLILGVLGAMPMLALSTAIETSESPLVSGLNLSTNLAVLRLFGPTPQPIQAFVASLLMATTAGVIEETVFRGQALPYFAALYGHGDVLTGVFLSTLLFAVLHTNPFGFFKGKEGFIDNSALLVLQMINGTIFAFLYLITGNLAVPIITHTLYDLYVLYKTHLVDVAGQMEYAKEEALLPISSQIEQKWARRYGEDWVKEAKETFYLMDTKRDGELSRTEVRVALYAYGINLSKLESEELTEAADIDGNGSINFEEYLEFIGPKGGRNKAARDTLLGPTSIM